MFILNTPAKEAYLTRDKVDFCCYNPLDITVSSFEWDACLLLMPPLPNFYDTGCLRKQRYITVSWSKSMFLVDQSPGKVWGPTPLNAACFWSRPAFIFHVPSKLMLFIISGLICSCSWKEEFDKFDIDIGKRSAWSLLLLLILFIS